MSSLTNDILSKQDGEETSVESAVAQYAKTKHLQLQEAERFYGILKQLNKDANIAEQQAAIDASSMSAAEKLRAQKEIQDLIAANEKRALEATKKYRKNLLDNLNTEEREQYYKTQASKEQRYKRSVQEQLNADIQAAQLSGKTQKQIASDIRKLKAAARKEEEASDKREREAKREAAKAHRESVEAEIDAKLQSDLQKLDPNLVPSDKARTGTEDEMSRHRLATRIKDLSGGPAAAIDKKHKEAEARSIAAQSKKEAIQEEMAGLDANNPDDLKRLEELQKEFVEANKEAVKAGNVEAATKTAKLLSNAIASAYKSSFAQAENMLTSYQAHINARLQGSEKTYKSITDKVTSNLSLSPFVKSVDVLEKLREATDQGIVYNLEQRAFLASISDKIANTFDAFDSNLLRLIRLQQADTTAARLGMEASLTKFFNSMFSDSSYLNDAANTVAAALVEASAIMNKNSATEFEYIVQKWLGSLSSLGMDSSTINSIAEGINYIATGDVSSLANNNSLQTLFAMSASNANLEYSQLLLKGLDASSTNDLLRSMVEYLKRIAEESENNVVRSAYADIFDLSVADMRAISNLTENDISKIHGTVMSYSNMENELNTQMKQLITRVDIASMLSTLYENVVYGVASDMVNNPATFGMTKMLDFMVENGVNINIPFINAMGFGLDLNAGVTDLMQIALGATQGVMLVTNILQGLASGGGMNLNNWGATEYNKRGDSFNFSSYSTIGGTSGSTYVSNSSTSDMSSSSISSATDDAEETGKITNKNQKTPEKTTDDFYKAIIGKDATDYVKINDDTLLRVYDENGKFLKVHDSALSFKDEQLMVIDESLNSTLNANFKELRELLQHTQFVTVLAGDSGLGNVNMSSSGGAARSNGEDPLVAAFDSAGKYLRVKDTALQVNSDNKLLVYDSTLTSTSAEGFKDLKELKDKITDTTFWNDCLIDLQSTNNLSGVLDSSGKYLQVFDSAVHQAVNSRTEAIIAAVTNSEFWDGRMAKVPVDTTLSKVVASGGSYLRVLDSNLGQAFNREMQVLPGFIKDAQFWDDRISKAPVDTTLSSVFDSNGNYLRVKDSSVSFSDNQLKVIDNKLNSTVSTELDKIYNLLNSRTVSDVVKLADGTTVGIDKNAIIQAFKEALYGNDDVNLSTIISLLNDGRLVVDKVNQSVPVKTEGMDSLSVTVSNIIL